MKNIYSANTLRALLLLILTIMGFNSLNAQLIKVINTNTNDTVVYVQSATTPYKVLFEGATAVSSITLDKDTVTIFEGLTTTLSATVLPATAGDKSITWSTSDANVATVVNGVVTALSADTATITATANDGSGVSASCVVIVSNDPSDQYEYVDLGLPSGLKWAKMNVGATSITDYGDYFAWGETSGYNSGKSNFSISTYKYYKDSTYTDGDGFEVTIHGYSKYVRSSDASQYGFNGFYDDKTTLDSIDDAATVNWGRKWRMPTQAEWSELRNNCTWTWATLNGKNGYKVTGTNGNWIFLPTAGYRADTSLSRAGSYGYYWSSSLYSSYSDYAYSLLFNSSGVYTLSDYRYYGQSVRPVCQ